MRTEPRLFGVYSAADFLTVVGVSISRSVPPKVSWDVTN